MRAKYISIAPPVIKNKKKVLVFITLNLGFVMRIASLIILKIIILIWILVPRKILVRI